MKQLMKFQSVRGSQHLVANFLFIPSNLCVTLQQYKVIKKRNYIYIYSNFTDRLEGNRLGVSFKLKKYWLLMPGIFFTHSLSLTFYIVVVTFIQLFFSSSIVPFLSLYMCCWHTYPPHKNLL